MNDEVPFQPVPAPRTDPDLWWVRGRRPSVMRVATVVGTVAVIAITLMFIAYIIYVRP